MIVFFISANIRILKLTQKLLTFQNYDCIILLSNKIKKGDDKMGDRANIEMVYESGEKIYFYTHWSGSELPEILQNALKRGKGRWDDEAYLARIIFSEMIQNEVLSETGYGIAPYICDNEHPIISVKCSNKTVTIEGVGSCTFEQFVNNGRDNF